MPGIQNIPIELCCAILRELPTPKDIASAIQSSKLFYDAFRLQRHIVGPILCAQIDTRLLPHVAALLELDRMWPKHRFRNVEIFFSKTTSQATKDLTEVTLCEAVHVMDRHNAIKVFAEKYAAEALALLHKEKVFDSSISHFSPSEIYRIERSLYVFELYCVVYGRRRRLGDHEGDDTIRDQQRHFFAKFAPWEHEQLACVYEFLMRQFQPPFDDVGAHDIEFGHMYLWVGTSWMAPALVKGVSFEGFIALGVKFLERVITASTYEERHRLLDKYLLFAQSSPSFKECIIEPYAINQDNPVVQNWDHWFHNGIMLDAWNEGSDRFKRRDPDYGPESIWCQYHDICDEDHFVMSADTRASRDVAYVMMDMSRVEAMTHFKGHDVSKRWYPVDQEKHEIETSRKFRSCMTRARIYDRGGRGWWSEDDASQIQWLY